MVDDDVHAIAQIILSGREQLVLLRPMDNMILMTVLQHEKKVKDADQFLEELSDPKLTKEEVKLTKTLISASKVEDFEFGSFEDQHAKNLTQLIQMKIDGQEIVSERDPEEPKILNLMDALKKSVAEAQAATHKSPAPAGKKKKKMAGSTTKKKTAARKKKSG